MQKGPLGYFLSKLIIFFYFLNLHYLKLVCEHFSRIAAIQISFLWGPKYGVNAAASFSANVTSCSCDSTHIFITVILNCI